MTGLDSSSMVTPSLLETMKRSSEQLTPYLVSMRRHLHSHPELSFQETATHDLVVAELSKVEGVEIVKQHVAGTGVVARVVGTAPLPSQATGAEAKRPRCVLIREDMDALPMDDLLDTEYRSKHAGRAHSCGHDVHVSCLLGAARILAEVRDRFSGECRLIFQPGEETTGGALPMIAEGAAEGIDAALSLHVMAYNPVKTIAVREGFISASEDDLVVTIVGRGGHASNPHLASNPVEVACSIVASLQGYVSRVVSPLKHVVLTVTQISSGTGSAINVIPPSCTFAATFRTFDPEARAELQRGIPKFCAGIAETFNCTAEVTMRQGFASGRNDPSVVLAVREITEKMYGHGAIVDIPEPEMGSEDFFYFSLDGKVPACQFWLGGANAAKGITADNHNPHFDVDEDCLPMGAASLAAIALRLLDHPAP